MRFIFYALIALNLGYFAWQIVGSWQADLPASPNPVELGKSGHGSIKLLSEARTEAYRYESDASVVEQSPELLVKKTFEEPAEMVGEEVSQEGAACVIFGPFVDERESLRFVRFLQGLKLSAQVQKEEVSLAPSFWAYMPPFASAEQALAMMSKLKVKGVKSFLINEGELRNGLSFGVYQDRAQVEKIEKVLQDLNLNLEVAKKSKSYQYDWVWVPLIQGEIPAAEILEQVRQQYPRLRGHQKVCKSVASGD